VTDEDRAVRRRRRVLLAKGALAVALVVGAVEGIRWYAYPAHHLEHRIRSLHLPGTVHVTREEVTDNGWLCVDECSSVTRYYVSELSEDATVTAVADALRRDGFTVDVGPCAFSCHDESDAAPYVVRDIDWSLGLTSSGFVGTARVGTRADRRVGLDIALVEH
jgi:hypothetical protein